jgi:hypothetical protein
MRVTEQKQQNESSRAGAAEQEQQNESSRMRVVEQER